jgi:chromosomal replication initiation ATPase DnaA
MTVLYHASVLSCNMQNSAPVRATMHEIAVACAQQFKVSYAEMIGRRRFGNVCRARQEAMRQMRAAGYSDSRIALHFSGRDRSTASHNIRVAEARIRAEQS